MNTIHTIIEGFDKIAAADPSAPAVSDAHRMLNREDLSQMVNTIVSQIPDRSKRVGIIMDHTVEMIAAVFAVLKTGAAYVPVEPTFPKGRIRFMMEEAAVTTVITNTKYQNLIHGIETVVVDPGLTVDPCAQSITNDVKATDLAYILYTSGTTGKPKGVSVTHANVCHYVRAFQNEFHPESSDIMLQYAACTFDIFVEEVITTLLSGASLAIPADKEKQDIHKLMDFVDRNQVTMMSGFPYLLQEMNELSSIPKSLRLLISGGDVIRESYVTNLIDQVLVYNTYGPSETTVCASYYNCSTGKALADGTYPIGKPVLGTDIMVMDERENQVDDGQIGEICILGDGVSNGYIGRRDEENKAFVSLSDGRCMYHSGDLGYVLPDGNIAFLHRKDTQVMIYGKRIEVSEVQNVLMCSDLVKQAYVLPKTDDRHLSYMVAYIVKEKETTHLNEIKMYLEDYLAAFMIPEFLVEVDSLPLNQNGKVDIAMLPDVNRSTGA